MDEAVPTDNPKKAGAMAAVLGMETSKIEELILDIEDVDIANYNCPGQTVITCLLYTSVCVSQPLLSRLLRLLVVLRHRRRNRKESKPYVKRKDCTGYGTCSGCRICRQQPSIY